MSWPVLALAAAALASPEESALGWLAREAPSWPEQNRCFSCHNNGDAVRALYTARRLRYPVPSYAMAATNEWLQDPARWDTLPGNPAFSDKRLARIQFAAALADGCEAGVLRGRDAALEAARSLLPLQHADGYWPLDGGDVLGNPTTYGIPLATAMCVRTLRTARKLHPGAAGAGLEASIERACRWLGGRKLSSTLDGAAALLALADGRPEAREYLLRAQSSSGGWGPYPKSPVEPFDTAVALLALAPLSKDAETTGAVRRGRYWLLQEQLPDGSWRETTRPPGAQSYAQRVSTTGWAALALLATKP